MLAPACLPRSLWWEKRTERGPLVSQLAGCVDLGDTASQLLEWLASLRVLASTSSDRAGGRKRGRKGDWLTPIPIAADAASFLTFSGATSYVQRGHKPVYRLVSAWRMFDCCEINLARHRSPETTSPSKRVLVHPLLHSLFPRVHTYIEYAHEDREALAQDHISRNGTRLQRHIRLLVGSGKEQRQHERAILDTVGWPASIRRKINEYSDLWN